ncbi:MAG: STAS domain-containing protein [Clostridia bacterium]|nr:STAS domain-containing protein [Clostridiales bacterium]MBQ4263890.1 STAS domain-containing protein [Clostridia bacterium]MBQ6715101.1 STAS domain-containing protein [Clostridia bacterium]
MLRYDEDSKTLTVRLSGELDQHMAEKIRNTIDSEILKSGANNLVFDMSESTFMDSSGIGMLIGRYKLMKRRNGGVEVMGMQENVMRIFKMSGLNQIMKVKERA